MFHFTKWWGGGTTHGVPGSCTPAILSWPLMYLSDVCCRGKASGLPHVLKLMALL